ncbi:MAG: CTP synthetase [Candidatus Marinimicrobia bacterium]|nr:CTP synthetase [Candidatus Neomarinimicrobiota bacterium]
MSKKTKYIFVFGGVISGLGKGIVASSLGYLLKSSGFKVTIQKLDPYLNVDPGTMNPYQHGEVFVLDDGSETDLDLGHYERFIDESLTAGNTTSSGRVYWDVLKRERKGDYLGDTIQVIPHITDEIKRRILNIDKDGDYDVVISEVGGTVGDIEGLPFYEAIRQLRLDLGKDNSTIVHTTLLPFINAAGEIKTKPTQHSVMKLREIGLEPDFLVCRTEHNNHLDVNLKKKLGLFCNVETSNVFESPDVETIYEIPLVLHRQGFDKLIVEKLKMKPSKKHQNISYLEKFVNRFKGPKHHINIAICGKYNSLHDAYKSILEAFNHASIDNNAKIHLKWVDTEILEKDCNPDTVFKGIDAILIPGGFGNRGIEGKVISSRYARENKIPFLGICLGMQCAVIDYARNVCMLKNANSTEFNLETKYPVIDIMENQKKVISKGATMRLGSYSCKIKKNTLAYDSYKKNNIDERHRHRYEFNNQYMGSMEDKGLVISGINSDLELVEIIEIKDHPWFIGVQFHPELKSRIMKTHPLFLSFIKSAVSYNKKN